MKTLFIELAEDSPEVLLIPENGHLTIRGRSYMEDTLPFYTDILEWSREYFKKPQPHTTLELEFEYINSASHRMIMDIIGEFNKYFIMGHDVEVVWNYHHSDESLAEMGEDIQEMFDLPVRCKEIV